MKELQTGVDLKKGIVIFYTLRAVSLYAFTRVLL